MLPDASFLDDILRATIAKHDRATDRKAIYDGNRRRARLSRGVPHALSSIQERWETELIDLCGTLPDHHPEIGAMCRYFLDLLEGDTNERNCKPKGREGTFPMQITTLTPSRWVGSSVSAMKAYVRASNLRLSNSS